VVAQKNYSLRSQISCEHSVSAPSEVWCILQGESPRRVRLSQLPVLSVVPVAEFRQNGTNKTGKAYTENHAGRRGDRAP